jgi:peptidoglycan/LPS O-acetylase OafA/YrhL
MNKVYFKGLSEIRAIAALFVLFHHLELYKHRDFISSIYDTPLKYFISHLGKNGVYIFFVLSGFLITYLLLTEKKTKKKIDIKKFYFRRILRIWPLYYLIVLISFTIIPFLALNFETFQEEAHYYSLILFLQDSPLLTLLLFLLFLPNLALSLRPAVVGASQSWSVGVEEQFYVIWPHLINRVEKKNILITLFVTICFLPQISKLTFYINPTLEIYLSRIIKLVPIHFMSVGAIGAFFIFYFKDEIQKILMNKYLFFLNTISLFIFMSCDFKLPLRGLVFGFIIIFEILFIVQPHFKFNLRSKYLEKVGDISYGVYMYHPLVMYISFSFWNTIYPIENVILYNICIYSCVITSTLILSKLSFLLYEKPFIKLKNKKFTIIHSGKTISNKT